jgi:hypothetical protein
LTKPAAEPATPPDPTDAVRELSDSYEEAVVLYLANVSDSEIRPPLNAADDATFDDTSDV